MPEPLKYLSRFQMIIGPQHTNMANIINASEIFSFAETLSRLLKALIY